MTTVYAGARDKGCARWAAVLAAGLLALLPAVAAGNGVLYESNSAYGKVIVTDEGDGTRALRFAPGGARQSLVKPGDPDYLGLPYSRVALAALALCAEPRRILVVGLGGGTLPMFLNRHYPEAAIDAVDINPEVLRVAKAYFGFRENAKLRAHIADGRKFIEATRDPYDLILLDAFGTDAVPAHLTTQEFLKAVRRAVRPDGVVVGNIWHRRYNPQFDSMVRTYRRVFDELAVLEVEDTANRILVALPRQQRLDRNEFARLARQESLARRFQFDMGDLVDKGYNADDASGHRGQVLRDRDLKQP
jgi:spermidine synthase